MLATLQGSPMAKPESLTDKAGGKCLTCRQAGHWANLVTSLLKWLATNAINWDTGRHSALKCQSSAKPSLTMIQQDWSGPLQQAHLSQITIMGLEPRVQLDVASRSENFLVDTGATYSVLTSCSRAFSPETCTILGATGKTITKRFTQALLCCWDGQIFFHPFLVVPECPTPLLGTDLSPPLKSCNYWCTDRRSFKNLSWGQINYFYQPSETTPEWERPFVDVWSKNPQISSSADEKSRPDYIPLWGS